MIGKILIGFQFGTINNDDLVRGGGNSNSSEVSAVTPFPRPLTRLTSRPVLRAAYASALRTRSQEGEGGNTSSLHQPQAGSFSLLAGGVGVGVGGGVWGVGCGVWGVMYGKGSGNEHAIAAGYMHKSSGNGTQRNISWRIYNF